jgi:hypothetical protein
MKIMTCLIVSLAATSCLASDRSLAQRPVIEGLEHVEVEIQDHFAELLADGIDASGEADAISVAETANEKFVVVDTGDELRMYLIVKDGEGYETAVQIAVENSLSIADDEEVELLTTVIESNPRMLTRSQRLQNLKAALKRGDNLTMIATAAVQEQSRLTRVDAVAAAQQVAIEVDCVGSGSAVCCGFASGQAVRVICVCHTGSHKWVLCYDSGWQN